MVCCYIPNNLLWILKSTRNITVGISENMREKYIKTQSEELYRNDPGISFHCDEFVEVENCTDLLSNHQYALVYNDKNCYFSKMA
jgi:hypothetical protein